ncbi:MAG: DUF1801 domain-containing protein [Myxococcales bacterium]|nr:DUF1801 domain-containing protein [Myxococcales bacterium]
MKKPSTSKVISGALSSPEVSKVYQSLSPKIRNRLFEVRKLILEVAEDVAPISPIRETLKWGQPSYLPTIPRTGTTVRVGHTPKRPHKFSVYFHCQTTLVETFRELFPQTFEFGGNRSLIFDVDQPLPVEELKQCVHMAFTYHLKRGRGP